MKHECKICGDTNIDNFYGKQKNKCKKCISNIRKGKIFGEENIDLEDWERFFEPGFKKWLHDYIQTEVIPDLDKHFDNLAHKKLINGKNRNFRTL